MLNCLEKTEYFIETGLYLGYTSYFFAKNFPNVKCYSCDNNSHFFLIWQKIIFIIIQKLLLVIV